MTMIFLIEKKKSSFIQKLLFAQKMIVMWSVLVALI
jgi:hypothetical protein